MIPTKAHIVTYNTTKEEQKAWAENPAVNTHEQLPAIVVAVNEGGTLNLKVMLDGEGTLTKRSVGEGTEGGTWAWPERV